MNNTFVKKQQSLIEDKMENDLPTDLSTVLCRAVKKNDLNTIIDLISKGADVNNFNENNELPLQIAIKMRSIEIIKELIQKGANINVKIHDKDETLIEYAMKESDPDIVLLLAEKSATDILNNDTGETLLHYAAKYNILELVQNMIHKGMNVDTKTNEDVTPLHIAAEYGHYDIVKYLCSVGADVNARNCRNSNALHYAINRSNDALEISKFLIDNGTEIELENCFGYTPLQFSLDRNIEIAKLLIEKGADVNRIYKNTHYARCNLGGTLLHWASRGYDNDSIIKFLIENGANINATENDGRTPLCLYIKHSGSTDMINYFIEHGADLYNSNGDAPLYWAFYMRNQNAQNLLINLMEDFNVPIDTYNMRAPLHIVKDLHHMELIISKGADVNIRDKDGNTPLHLVECLSLVKCLVKNGADINARNYEGSTPLHTNSNFPVVEYLIEKGADIHAINNEGYTPLHLAKSVFIAEYLMEQGADVKAVTNNGKTMLHSVAEFTTYYDSYSNDAPSLIRFYISKGVNVNATDKNGDTALHLCVKNNDLGIYLLEEGANLDAVNNEGKKPMDYDYGSFQSIIKFMKELSIGEECMKSQKIESFYIHRIQLSYMSIDDHKTTALHLIAKRCKANIIKNIFKQLQHRPLPLNIKFKNNVVNARDINYWTPLHYAAQRGDSIIVIHLLENGAMYNAETVNNETPLKLTTDDRTKRVLQLTEQVFNGVISGNYDEVVNSIDSQYGIINASDKSGNSPLYLAIFHDHPDIIELLLQNKADITQINEGGHTVLHLACTKGYNNVVEDLLQHLDVVFSKKYSSKQQQQDVKGNFVNVQAIGGTTALHIAAKQNNMELVKLLLSSGASYNMKNEEGKIPVDLSTNGDVITLFKFVEELFNDAKHGKADIIDKLRNLASYEFQMIAFVCTKQRYTLKDILQHNQYKSILEEFSELESKKIIEKNVYKKSKNPESSEESEQEDLGFGLFD